MVYMQHSMLQHIRYIANSVSDYFHTVVPVLLLNVAIRRVVQTQFVVKTYQLQLSLVLPLCWVGWYSHCRQAAVRNVPSEKLQCDARLESSSIRVAQKKKVTVMSHDACSSFPGDLLCTC